MSEIRSRLLFAKIAPWFGGSLLVFLHLFTLGRSPAPHVDEAWLVSRAWGMAQTGLPYGQLDAGLMENLVDHYWLVYQAGITALQSLLLRLAGSPDLLILRFFSFFCGMGLLWACFQFARQYLSKNLALLTCFFTGLSLAFFHSAHQVRYDMMAAALGYASLAIAGNSKKRWGWHWIAGLFLGLSIETHLNSLLFIPAVGLVYLFRSGWRILKDPQAWGFAAGGFISIFGYLFVHVLPDPGDFWRANQLNFSGQMGQSLAQKWASFTDIWILLLIAGSTFSLLTIPAAIDLWRHGEARQKQFLCLSLTIILTAALIIPYKVAHYAIYITPPVIWLATWWLVRVFQKPWRGQWQDFVLRIFASAALIGNIGLSLTSLIPDGQAAFQADLSLLKPYLRPEDRLMGSQVYWLGLSDHSYHSWELLFLYPRVHPGSDLEDALEYYRPDVLLIDQPIQDLISDQIDPSSRWAGYHVSRREWDAFMQTHTVTMIELNTQLNSPLTLYRITWNP